MRDHHRVHIRQATARHARLQLGQTLFRYVETRTRRPVLRMIAPSDSVLPPAPAQKSTTISPRFGADDGRQDLATLVLYFDVAVLEQRQVLQLQAFAARAGLAAQTASASLRIGASGQLGDRLLRGWLSSGIHAQVQRSWLSSWRLPAPAFLPRPFAQPACRTAISAYSSGSTCASALAVDLPMMRVDPLGFLFADAAQCFQADCIGHAQQGQTTHGGAAARFGEIGVERSYCAARCTRTRQWRRARGRPNGE